MATIVSVEDTRHGTRYNLSGGKSVECGKVGEVGAFTFDTHNQAIYRSQNCGWVRLNNDQQVFIIPSSYMDGKTVSRRTIEKYGGDQSEWKRISVAVIPVNQFSF